VELFDSVRQIVKDFLARDSSGHNIDHSDRVFDLAMKIQVKEGGDKEVIGVAALVHDLCRPWEKETGKLHFGPEALMIIRQELSKVNLSSKTLGQVLDIVAKHDIYDWTDKDNTKSIELKIVQDADNLDALGAIGIARSFTFGGANGLNMYNKGENLEFSDDFVEDPNHRTSTIAHFYEKLFKLKDNMNTKTGLVMANERHEFMRKFVEKFFSEWEGAS
jgi:uncharacterized protein